MALEVDVHKKLDGFTLDVSFRAEPGVTALLGGSGSGKSMTLRCVAGVERPDKGYIALDGRVLFDSEAGVDLPPQKRRVGYLFQRYALFPTMTVRQNVETGLLFERDRAARRAKRDDFLARFHLEGLEGRYPRELSGGQMQRVALCRMLASEPEAILLDEPFAALDSFLRWQLEREVRDTLAAFPGAALLVSHDRGEAYRMSDHVCVLSDGRSEPLEETKTLFAAPRTLQAALITGCKNCVPAERLDAHTLLVPVWNARLLCDVPEGRHVTHAGVRAHYVLPCAPDAENALRCRVLDAAEDVFTRVLTLMPSGGAATLRTELDKGLAEGLCVGDEAYFSLPRAAVMPLDGGTGAVRAK